MPGLYMKRAITIWITQSFLVFFALLLLSAFLMNLVMWQVPSSRSYLCSGV